MLFGNDKWVIWCGLFLWIFGLGTFVGVSFVQAKDKGKNESIWIVTGLVQYEDLRRVPQATVELRDQEGTLIETQLTNEGGEFILAPPESGIYSIRATQSDLSSESTILKIENDPFLEVKLTLAHRQELTLEVVASLPPIQHRLSGESYSISRKDIEELPRGNNIALNDLLLTLPSAVDGGLKQVHIRQDHANYQFRVDGVPIPDTVSSVFTDVISPRTWERADIILGGPEAQFGNKTAAVIDVITKSGTKPGFGSVQYFGGSNETINPAFEYGGTVGSSFRYYLQNSFTSTNRGINPPTLGKTIFHDQSNQNQTMLRGDWQMDNQNSMSWLFLNSIAKFQIPTQPGLAANPTIVGLIQGTDPGFEPVTSQNIDEYQKENNQYSHLVWRHDWSQDQFLSLSGFFQHSRATFTTDPFNALSYTQDTEEPFSASDQDRWSYVGGIRFDYSHRLNPDHLIKTGFQIQRTQAVNKTRLSAFLRDGAGDP
ncbi:MAG: TonB-dependent receptor, partial [Nitrospira sp.]|nr:TonB-dependent receptor [Nitrospira sp.]